jgi:hypothetical protein
MHVLTAILLFGLLLSVLFSAIILSMVLVNPRLMLQDYPKDVQAAVPPKTAAEKRQTLYWGLPLWVFLLGCPTLAALWVKAAHGGFLDIFAAAFGVLFLSNLVDWLILDWLIFCTITPSFAVLPGTEGMAGYKNYGMHFRGFLIGTALALVIALIITAILVVL